MSRRDSSNQSSDASASGRPKVSPRRKWVFRLAAATIVPLLLFSTLEAGLRIGGYGYPTGFYIKSPTGDGYLTNLRFGWRFFPKPIARGPHPGFVRDPKPQQVYRIFVLGGSAAMGYPQEELNFGRILQTMLTQSFPDTRFEVINAAVTAVNSHAVLPAIKDCARLEPDLFIIYLGNNEVVGPFGPGTAFARFSPNLTTIRASLWLESTKTGQLANQLAGVLSHSGKTSRQWRGMAMMADNHVSAVDPHLEKTYQHFRANLRDICRAARLDAPVLLCTVATNLKDSAPFASQHRGDLAAEDLARWQRHYESAVTLQNEGEYTHAIKAYLAGAAIDDMFADMHFRLARCLEATQAFDQAKEHYRRARDVDVVRFRADTRINAIIRDVARRQQGRDVDLVDVERAFEDSAQTDHGIVGRSLLYEHVHMNFDGSYVAARALFDKVVERLAQSTRKPHAPTPAAPSRDQCAQALALTGWDLHNMADRVHRMTRQPPFPNRLDHNEQSEYTRQQEQALQTHLSPAALDMAVHSYRKVIAQNPDDVGLRLRFALLLEHRGMVTPVIEHRQFIVDRIPNHANAHLDLGAALYKAGRHDEAINHFRHALQINPWLALAHNNLGFAFEMKKDLDAAIAHYRQALQINPELALAHNNLGMALRSKGQSVEAVEHFRHVLRIEPDNQQARRNLQELQATEQK